MVMRRPSLLSLLAGFILAVGVFSGLNFMDLWNGCTDCDFPAGLPFAFVRLGGWTTERRMFWPGAIGDCFVYVTLAIAAAWLFDRMRVARRRDGRPDPDNGEIVPT